MGTAEFSDHLKAVGPKNQKSSISGIDYIYLINLDQRPEKWEKSLGQLERYGITPHRFSAIYGWDLSIEAKNELGIQFAPRMLSDQWVLTFPNKLRGHYELDFLREELYGSTVFCHWMRPGAIGCYLSHLSVLQDAYDSGYHTIWIL
jgi:GR25 family glycosyltransferase involved in LPS biosynthesis